MTLRAYAKINIGLRILQKREDGYHDIETIFHRVDLFDEIALEDSGSLSMESDGTEAEELPLDERNLCMRAARMLRDETRVLRGVHVALRKRIPAGGGLGGGSSDAATTLLGLNGFWGLNLSREFLHRLASALGSDVPYFLLEGSAYATGRGELLEPLRFTVPYWIVLASPRGVSVPTAWAFSRRAIAPGSSPPGDRARVPLRDCIGEFLREPARFAHLVQNDFEPLVFPHYEPVRRLKELLAASGALFTQMSGTGSSVYAFFQSGEAARRVMAELGKEYRVFLTRPGFSPPPPSSSLPFTQTHTPAG